MSTTTLQRGKGSTEALLSDRFYRRSEERSIRPTRVPPITMEAERPLVIPFGEGSIVFEPAPDFWVVPILERVCELGSLPPNWNSYGGKPVNPDIATAAVTLVLNLLTPTDPVPSVVPTSRGGIMLEWHEAGLDLEVDIESPCSFHIALEDGEHEEEHDHADLDMVEAKLNLVRRRLK